VAKYTYHCHGCGRVWPSDDKQAECKQCTGRNIETLSRMKEGGERSVIYKCMGFHCTDYRESHIPGDDKTRGGNPF